MDAALLPAPPYSLDITSIQVSFMRPRDETVETPSPMQTLLRSPIP